MNVLNKKEVRNQIPQNENEKSKKHIKNTSFYFHLR